MFLLQIPHRGSGGREVLRLAAIFSTYPLRMYLNSFTCLLLMSHRFFRFSIVAHTPSPHSCFVSVLVSALLGHPRKLSLAGKFPVVGYHLRGLASDSLNLSVSASRFSKFNDRKFAKTMQ